MYVKLVWKLQRNIIICICAVKCPWTVQNDALYLIIILHSPMNYMIDLLNNIYLSLPFQKRVDKLTWFYSNRFDLKEENHVSSFL